MSVAVTLGSAFSDLPGVALEARRFETPFGEATLHRALSPGADAWVCFRHGHRHRHLPHQVPYRAQAWALRAVGCEALVVTSSVGVLNPAVPLYTPLAVGDLVMLEERLPCGAACTIFDRPRPGQGHLVIRGGLLSAPLSAQLRGLAAGAGVAVAPGEVVFLYRGGPRTKTAAENRLFASWGVDVNSMTLAPEVVLANELEIPTAAVVVGHKYSVAGGVTPDRAGIAASLTRSKEALARLVAAFLREGEAVPFENEIYRFD